MSQSEHPILRALSIRAMLHRKSFNHFDIIMNHLDDTAFVSYNDGEFGIHRRRIADDILFKTNFKTLADKDEIINEVLTKHNNLTSAYYVLENIPLQEKYYPYIRDMAQRKRGYDDGTDFGDGFHIIEFALYGLARFKKQNDIPFIKQKFLDNLGQMSHLSFQIMQEFPNETYLDLFEKIYYDNYLELKGNKYDTDPTNFINALAVYKNERSAKLLDSILDSLISSKRFNIKRNNTDYELVYAIWNNPCAAYSEMRKRVAPFVLPEKKPIDEATRLKQAYQDSVEAMTSLGITDSVENHIRFLK